MGRKINIFVIYTGGDKDMMLPLLDHLNPLKDAFNLSIWHDDPIIPGQPSKTYFESRIHHTDIFLLLISDDFLKSQFIRQPEFKAIIDRHKENKSVAIPVIFDHSQWDNDFKLGDSEFNLNKLQVLPEGGRPIRDWDSSDQAYENVMTNLKETISSFAEGINQKDPKKDEELKAGDAKREDQLNISFTEKEEAHEIVDEDITAKEQIAADEEEDHRLWEEAEAKRRAEVAKRIREQAEASARRRAEEDRLWEEAMAKRRAEKLKRIREEAATSTNRGSGEERRLMEASEAESRTQKEKEIREETEALRRAENERRIREETEVKRMAEKEKKIREEAEARRRAGEEKRLQKESEAKKRAEEEEKIREETEAKRRAEEEKKAREEAEAKKRAGKEKNIREETEVRRRVEEENRFQKESESKTRAEEEKKIVEEAEAKRRAEKKKRLNEIGTSRSNEDEYSRKPAGATGKVEEKNRSIKKRILVGSIVAVLAIVGIWFFSLFNKGSEKQSPPLEKIQATDVKDSIVLEKTNTDSLNRVATFSKLAVGDIYDGGFIFAIDHATSTGKMAHLDDAGPMSWQSAMKIDEQLGEGWRLPTFDELRIMHQTIGQGATNSGEFSGELYWSATAYDEYQARLVRFRDGNTSYHYNKNVEQRKFLVRAVRDFSQ